MKKKTIRRLEKTNEKEEKEIVAIRFVLDHGGTVFWSVEMQN